MNKRKIISLTAWALMMLLLVFMIYREYKNNLRTCQITFQSEVSPEADGLERVIVSDISGVQRTLCEGFEYEADRNRYVLDMRNLVPGQPCFLNLESAVWKDSGFLLEYRLKAQDGSVDESDSVVITSYGAKGSVLGREIRPLADFTNTKSRYDNIYDFTFPVFQTVTAAVLLLAALWLSRRNFFGVLLSVVTAGFFVQKYLPVPSYTLSACVAAAVTGYAVYNLVSLKGQHAKDCLRDIAVPALFFACTLVFYVPAQLVMSNADDFGLSFFTGLLPSLLVFSAGSPAVLYVICLCISGRKIRQCLAWLVYFVTLGAYIQLNFLNPVFPTLDGGEIDFASYGMQNAVSAVFWIILAAVYIAVCVCVYKTAFAERIKKYGSYLAGALCIMQLASLAVLVLTVRINPVHFQKFTCEGEYELATKDNALIFMVDTLCEDAFRQWRDSSERADILEDFIVYDNYITAGSPTRYGVPMLLTGVEFSQLDDIPQIYDELYSQDNSLRRLRAFGTDLRIFSENDSVCGNIADLADNVHATDGKRVSNICGFGRELYRLVGFVAAPMQLKPLFVTYTGNITDQIKAEDDYRPSNIAVHERFITRGLSVGAYDRALRLYHMAGVHLPYDCDAALKSPGKTEQECLEGVMLHIGEYIDSLKELGLYDSSLIIILGDHGRHEEKDFTKANAALAIKYPQGAGSDEPDHRPVISRNILATVAEAFGEDYAAFGPAISDLDMNSYGARLHTSTMALLCAIDMDEDSVLQNKMGGRYALSGNAYDGTLTYREWNPYLDNLLAFGPDRTSVSIGAFPEGTEYSFAVDAGGVSADRAEDTDIGYSGREAGGYSSRERKYGCPGGYGGFHACCRARCYHCTASEKGRRACALRADIPQCLHAKPA